MNERHCFQVFAEKFGHGQPPGAYFQKSLLYERIAFKKSLVTSQGHALAAFICPGHPLLDSIIDLTLERHRDLLKRGAALVDERNAGNQPGVLFYVVPAHLAEIRNNKLSLITKTEAAVKERLTKEQWADVDSRHGFGLTYPGIGYLQNSFFPCPIVPIIKPSFL